MAVRIGKGDFAEKVLDSEAPVLVDFYSDSCIACKRLSPALGGAEEALEGAVRFYKVNTAFEPELTAEYDILSQPTLLLFRSGKEQARKSGVLGEEAILDWLDSILK